MMNRWKFARHAIDLIVFMYQHYKFHITYLLTSEFHVAFDYHSTQTLKSDR